MPLMDEEFFSEKNTTEPVINSETEAKQSDNATSNSTNNSFGTDRNSAPKLSGEAGTENKGSSCVISWYILLM